MRLALHSCDCYQHLPGCRAQGAPCPRVLWACLAAAWPALAVGATGGCHHSNAWPSFLHCLLPVGEWEDDGWVQSVADPQHCRVAGPGVTKAVAGQQAELVVEVGVTAVQRAAARRGTGCSFYCPGWLSMQSAGDGMPSWRAGQQAGPEHSQNGARAHCMCTPCCRAEPSPRPPHPTPTPNPQPHTITTHPFASPKHAHPSRPATTPAASG